MIYTVTLNPSIDYIMEIDDLIVGDINRSNRETLKVGGKGINVSKVLKEIGCESIACGFAAGNIGDFIISELNKEGIKNSFVNVKGNSRINVKLAFKNETAVNGSGCAAEDFHIHRLCDAIKSNEDDYIVLSGSLCRGLSDNAYAEIMKKAKGRFVVDSSRNVLINTLKHKPFLIKPNHIELGEIFNCNIKDFNDGIYYGKKLCTMGAENVIVSMGKLGAVFVNNSEEYIVNSNKVDIKNTVGAGDTLVAGFLYKYINGSGFNESLEFAVRLAETKICRI